MCDIDNNWVMLLFTSNISLTLSLDLVSGMGTCETDPSHFERPSSVLYLIFMQKCYVYNAYYEACPTCASYLKFVYTILMRGMYHLEHKLVCITYVVLPFYLRAILLTTFVV